MTARVRPPVDLRFRRPSDDDHRRLVDLVDDWFGGRRVRDQFGRFWFRHFSRTSWLAETADGEVAGVLIGFLAPDDPRTAVIQWLAVNPNLRRRGVGRELVERFAAEARSAGADELVIVVRPDEPIAVRFLRALGFEPDAGPGTQPLYGVPAYPDYEHEGEDRAIFRRRP
ncbi:MAG TPA: GNAT family N-acetyltransferase [Candidatus Binatia bacterium]|nr:GNAT family N-acetyltransferase [Candidatus Binatia bacterium]